MKSNRMMVLIALLGLSLSVAGAIPVAEKIGADAVQVERPARILNEAESLVGTTAYSRQSNSGNVLRCWQHGRLLYEGDGFNRVAPLAKAAVTVVARRKGEEGVSLINFNEAFCMLSER